MTKKRWEELKDGYGLELVPKQLNIPCCCCAESNVNQKVYTPESLPQSMNQEKRRKETANLIGKTYCRYHAEWYFGE